MNKAFYIIGIVFSVIFLIVVAYYIEAISSARFMDLYSSFDSYSDYGYSSYSYDRSNSLTQEVALWSLFFFASFITILLLGLIKVKTKTTKVLSIIGLSLSGIMLLWNFAVMASPGALSFDEVSPAWGLYCLTMLAFCIIGLIQSVRYGRRKRSGVNVAGVKESGDLLD